jgi:hypothetical protein
MGEGCLDDLSGAPVASSFCNSWDLDREAAEIDEKRMSARGADICF